MSIIITAVLDRRDFSKLVYDMKVFEQMHHLSTFPEFLFEASDILQQACPNIVKPMKHLKNNSTYIYIIE